MRGSHRPQQGGAALIQNPGISLIFNSGFLQQINRLLVKRFTTMPMSRSISLLLLSSLLEASPWQIEMRPNTVAEIPDWSSINHYRIQVKSTENQNRPILVRCEVPLEFNPDSVRVMEPKTGRIIPVKIEWTPPLVRICWRATGLKEYQLYFDTGNNGETQRLLEPAMVGAGDRVTTGCRGARARLSVGLWRLIQ